VGDVVTYNDSRYRCRIAHMSIVTWEPTNAIALWEKIVNVADGQWGAGVQFKVGDVVSYNGKQYRCRIAHMSITTWEPVNAGALWESV